MNDETNYLKWALEGVLGVIMAIMAWFGNRHIKRVDSLEKRVNHGLATKEDIDTLNSQHKDLQNLLKEVDDRSTKSREKVYERLEASRIEQKEDLREAIKDLKEFMGAKLS